MKANIFITIIETRFNFNISFAIRINFVFRVVTADTIESKKSVLYAKKRAADQLIIIKKNLMLSEIELKIVFEKSLTITRPNVISEHISFITKT